MGARTTTDLEWTPPEPADEAEPVVPAPGEPARPFAVAAFAGSDDEALLAQFASLARLAFLLCGDQARADDAAAEALARVWQRNRAAALDELRPYLRRTLVNVVKRSQRRSSVEQRAFARHGATPESERIETGVEDRTDIARALMTLPVDQRAVVVLRYFENLSEEEIAAALRIRPGTVKSRAARALGALRAAMEGESDV